MTTTAPFNPDLMKISHGDLITPIQKATKARAIAPVFTELDPTQDTVVIEELAEKIIVDYHYGTKSDDQLSSFEFTKTTVPVPRLNARMVLDWDDYVAAQAGKLDMSGRQQRIAVEMARREDMAFFGEDDKTLVKGPSDTTNNSTAWGATVLDVTTYALIESSLPAGIGQLIDNGIEVDQFPLFLAVTPDVYKLMMGAPSLKDGENGLALANRLLNELGAPKAVPGVIMTDKLGASITTVTGVPTYTASTSNAALFAHSPQHYGVFASVLDPRPGAIDKYNGARIRFVERWLPYFFKTEAIIYEAGVTIS